VKKEMIKVARFRQILRGEDFFFLNIK